MGPEKWGHGPDNVKNAVILYCGNIRIIRVYVNALYGTNQNPAVMQMLSHGGFSSHPWLNYKWHADKLDIRAQLN